MTAGIVRGKVTDSDSNMLISGIIITDEEVNFYRDTTNAFGGYDLKFMPGTYALEFTKGEYSTVQKTVTVESLKTYYLPDVRLTHLYDSYAKGWVPGDCHQHTFYSDGVDGVPIDRRWTDPIGDKLETYMRGIREISIRGLSEYTVEMAHKLK